MKTNNITVPYGAVWAVKQVFEILGLNNLLRDMKREQGAGFDEVARALVSFSILSRGLPVANVESVLDDPSSRVMYGISSSITRNDLDRGLKRLSKNRFTIFRHIDSVLKKRFGLKFDSVYLDWSATYVDGKAGGNIRFGHSKDHRPDRPQIAYGIAVDTKTSLPIGMTVERGNINDNPHFRRTFALIKGFLEDGAMLTFDAGANGKFNTDLLNGKGFHFLTRVTLNESDGKRIDGGLSWETLWDGTKAFSVKGNLGFFSEKRREETIREQGREGLRRDARDKEVPGGGEPPSEEIPQLQHVHRYGAEGEEGVRGHGQEGRRRCGGQGPHIREGRILRPPIQLPGEQRGHAQALPREERIGGPLFGSEDRDQGEAAEVQELGCGERQDDRGVSGAVHDMFHQIPGPGARQPHCGDRRGRPASFLTSHFLDDEGAEKTITSNFSPTIEAIDEAFCRFSVFRRV